MTRIVRTVFEPLLEGAPLLLLPDCTLVRWPANKPRPSPGAAFEGTTLTMNEKLLPHLTILLFSEDALARCDAAVHLPFRKLTRIYSYPQAKALCDASRRLAPEIRHYLRQTGGTISLFRLTRAAYAPNVTEQKRRVGLFSVESQPSNTHSD